MALFQQGIQGRGLSHMNDNGCRVTSAAFIRTCPISILVWLVVSLLMPSHEVLAQVTTEITADGTLGTTVTPTGSVYDITGGTRPGGGTNLFHSFGLFSVGGGDTANFLNDTGAATSNVLARVTGGQLSNIFGTLQTTGFAGANLFLMNPTGVVFGPTASLNVGGSVHVTTANSMVLTDTTVFDQSTAPAALTTAPVESFGFLPAAGAMPGPVEVQGSTLAVPAGATLSLVGGNVEVASRLLAPGGQILITSVAGNGQVDVATGEPSVGVNRGSVLVSANTELSTVPSGAGSGKAIAIRGGEITVVDSTITTSARGSPVGLAAAARDISFDATGSTSVTGSTLNSSSLFSRGSGDVTISGTGQGKITIMNSTIKSEARIGGDSGTITITDSIVNLRGATIRTQSSGSLPPRVPQGSSGEILLAGRTLDLSQGTSVSSPASGSGSGGKITLRGLQPGEAAEFVTLSGQGSPTLTQVTSNNTGRGTGGPIEVNTQSLRLTENAVFSSSTAGLAPGGAIDVHASDSILISGQGAGIFTESGGGTEKGGTINLQAGRSIRFANGAFISVESRGLGDAGGITLTSTAGSILLENSTVKAEASLADGGNIKFSAPETIRLKNSQVTTSVGGGPATVGGNIDFDPQFVLLQNSQVLAQAFQGQGGKITITTIVFLADANSIVDASSQFGLSGTVTIQSPIQNLSGSLAPMPEAPLQAAALLRAACAARMQGVEASTFVQRGRGGLPSEPGGFLKSPLLARENKALPASMLSGKDETQFRSAVRWTKVIRTRANATCHGRALLGLAVKDINVMTKPYEHDDQEGIVLNARGGGRWVY